MTPPAGTTPSRRTTLAHLALIVPWVTLVIGSFRPITDNSFLWHIRAGELQAGSGRILTNDPFSFTMAGEPWLTQSWLAEIGYWALHETFGLGFAAVLLLVLGLVTVTGVGIAAMSRSRSVMVTAGVVVLTGLLFPPVMVPRPVIFSFPLFAVVILGWDHRRLRWTLPFLFWLWASLHGSFLIGGAYVVLRLIAAREWRAWPHVMAAGVMTLLTPHGLGTARIVLDFAAAQPHLRLMQEWRTPDFLTPALAGFVVGLVWLLYSAAKGRLDTRDLWVVVPFLMLALSASRAVFPAWIAVATVVAGSASGVSPRWGKGFSRPVAAAAILVIVALPLLFVRPVELDNNIFPINASAYLEDVRTFHDDLSGGYFIFTDQFSEGVFIDDRAEFYRERIGEMVAVRAGVEPWESVFVRDGVEQALVGVDSPIRSLLTMAGWRELFRDGRYAVLRPQAGESPHTRVRGP